jgi:hypothetical protein
MSDRCGDGGEDPVPTQLERLGAIVEQRRGDAVWRKFLVAQAAVRDVSRRREMTTQRIFLMGQAAQLSANSRDDVDADACAAASSAVAPA